jgi:hypothetical protein
MNIQGWPVTYLGIVLLSAGFWLGVDLAAGLGVCGVCLIGVGAAQLAIG